MLACRTASQQKTLPTVRVFQAIRTTTLLHTGAANPYIVIVGFFVQNIKVYPDNVIVCSGVGTSITTGRTEFAPTHAGSLPNSEHNIKYPSKLRAKKLPNSEQNIILSHYLHKAS